MKRQNKIKLLLIFLLSFAFLLIPFYQSKEKNDKPLICVTTSFLQDSISSILGNKANVKSIIPSGVDPHSYTMPPSALQLINQADVVIYQGLGLESKLAHILQQNKTIKHLICATDNLNKNDLIVLSQTNNEIVYDPHIWFDPNLWQQAINYCAQQLNIIFPQLENEILKNTDEFNKQISELNNYISQIINKIPENKRKLISAHNSFAYFAKYSGFEIYSLLGISVNSQATNLDLQNIANIIVSNDIHAIFLEANVNEKLITNLINLVDFQGGKICQTPYLATDWLSKQEGENTYFQMFKTNIDRIYNGLVLGCEI